MAEMTPKRPWDHRRAPVLPGRARIVLLRPDLGHHRLQWPMAAGTLAGGWRIVKTMGDRITNLNPMQGSCAETGGAITLFLATFLGIPVSTTHTIAGAVAGVGAARRVSAVRWNIAGSIVIAWILTLPASALIAAMAYLLARLAS